MNIFQQLINQFNSLISPYKPKVISPIKKVATPNTKTPTVKPSFAQSKQQPSAALKPNIKANVPVKNQVYTAPAIPLPNNMPKLSMGGITPMPSARLTPSKPSGSTGFEKVLKSKELKDVKTLTDDAYSGKYGKSLFYNQYINPKNAVKLGTDTTQMFIRGVKMLQMQATGEKEWKPRTETRNLITGEIDKGLPNPFTGDEPIRNLEGTNLDTVNNLEKMGVNREVATKIAPLMVIAGLALDVTPTLGGGAKNVISVAKKSGTLDDFIRAISKDKKLATQVDEIIKDSKNPLNSVEDIFNQAKKTLTQNPTNPSVKAPLKQTEQMVKSESGALKSGSQQTEEAIVRNQSSLVSSSGDIISQTDKFPNKPQQLNVNRLNLSDEGKTLIRETEGDKILSKMSFKEIENLAAKSGISTKTYTEDGLRKRIAEELNLRKSVITDTNTILKSEVGTNEYAKLLKKIADESRVSTQQGTDIARQLAARNILANELDTPIQKVFKLLEQAGINPEAYLEKAKNVNFNNADDVVEFYRSFVPTKWRDFIDPLRYNSMLSSPLTHIVNISSNLLQSGVVAPIEKTLTGAIDLFASKATGKQQQHFMGEGAAFAKGYIMSMKEGLTRAKNLLKGEVPISNLDLERIPLATKGNKGKVVKTLEFPMKLMEAADQFFMAMTEGGVKNSLKYKTAKGGKVVGDVGEIATKEARYRLYRQALGSPNEGAVLHALDWIPREIMKARNHKEPLISTVAKFTFPFIATPTNIAKQSIEYSPFGFLTTFGASKPIEQVTKALLGTMASATAATLLGSGRLSWSEPVGDKRDPYRATGQIPYAVKLGDKWVSYTNLPPAISFNLALISALDSAQKEKKINDDTIDVVMKTVSKFGEYFADKSYFKQMGDLVDAAQGDPIGLDKILSNYPQQVIPMRAFSGWLARIVDDTQRKIEYQDKNFIEKQTQLLMQNIPILSKQLTPRTDMTGEEIKNQHRLLNSVFPYRISTEQKQKIAQYEESESAARLFTHLKTIDKKEGIKYLKDLEVRRPDMFNKIEKFSQIDKIGLGKREYEMVGSGVKDGKRARQIVEGLNKLTTKEERLKYLKKLNSLELINNDNWETISKQIQELKTKGIYKSVPDKQSGLLDAFIPKAYAADKKADPKKYISYVADTPDEYKDTISSAAEKHDIPANILSALLKQESNFNPNAKSPVGASGIAQFMPATAKEMGIDPSDPKQSIEAAARYLRQHLDSFDGDMKKALAAYNAGAGNVRKYGGIPPFKETQNYVKKIMDYANGVTQTDEQPYRVKMDKNGRVDYEDLNKQFDKMQKQLDPFVKEANQNAKIIHDYLKKNNNFYTKNVAKSIQSELDNTKQVKVPPREEEAYPKKAYDFYKYLIKNSDNKQQDRIRKILAITADDFDSFINSDYRKLFKQFPFLATAYFDYANKPVKKPDFLSAFK